MLNNKKSIIMLHKILIPAKQLNRSHHMSQLCLFTSSTNYRSNFYHWSLHWFRFIRKRLYQTGKDIWMSAIAHCLCIVGKYSSDSKIIRNISRCDTETRKEWIMDPYHCTLLAGPMPRPDLYRCYWADFPMPHNFKMPIAVYHCIGHVMSIQCWNWQFS